MKISKKSILIWVVTAVLFSMCLSIGYWLSLRKPLWNDELYTQTVTIETFSYKDILSVRVDEGSKAPLYYLIQKAFCDAFDYTFPLKWRAEWNIYDQRSQVFLRIIPNVFMSLSIVLIFYFFSRQYSLWAGLYAFLISLSSFMVWSYWVEARPYGLWFLLTTCQALLFIRMMEQKDTSSHIWRWLLFIHILLLLTVITSVPQVVIVTILVWLYKAKNWKKFIISSLVTFAICAPFSFQAKAFEYWLFNPLKLIYDSMPQEWLLLFFVYAFVLGYLYKSQGFKGTKDLKQLMRLKGAAYFSFMALIILAAFAMLLMLKLRSSSVQQAFVVSNRYFIFLAPVGIIGTTLFSVNLLKTFKENKWMLANVVILLVGLLLIRYLRLCMNLFTLSLY